MESEIIHPEIQYESLNQSYQHVTSVNQLARPVFAAVLKHYLTQLESIDVKITQKLRQSVLAQISLYLANKEERQRLNAWLRGDVEQLEVELNLRNMQQSIHHAYMGVCDYFGPARADELLTTAIKSTESLPIAHAFAPTNLI